MIGKPGLAQQHNGHNYEWYYCCEMQLGSPNPQGISLSPGILGVQDQGLPTTASIILSTQPFFRPNP